MARAISANPDGHDGFGGGIEFDSESPPTTPFLNITNSTVTKNGAYGGDAFASSGTAGNAYGGGISIFTGSGSQVTAAITACTISDNQTVSGHVGVDGKAQGGGVIFGGNNSGDLLVLINSTIAGNSAY